MKSILNQFRVGRFLAIRSLKYTSLSTNLLIIFVMMLTFINLVFVTGILVGLPAGSSLSYRLEYSGDLLLKNLTSKAEIEQSSTVLSRIESFPEVEAVSPRYLSSAQVEANFKSRRKLNVEADRIGTELIGIDPLREEAVTGISEMIIEGSYLEPGDEGYVLVGTDILSEYTRASFFESLENVTIGTPLRVSINGIDREVLVKGIVQSKQGEVGRRVYFVDTELRKLLQANTYNVHEMAVRLAPGEDENQIKKDFLRAGIGEFALVQTWRESQGDFLDDIENTFSLLANIISTIGLVAGLITIFIVIFVNAISKKRYIGILKGIGIDRRAIEISYSLQALFYSLIGTLLGLGIIFLGIKPYIDRNPIDFPFAEGILVTPFDETVLRVVLLLVCTMIAGYIPARIVTRKNTLEAILKR